LSKNKCEKYPTKINKERNGLIFFIKNKTMKKIVDIKPNFHWCRDFLPLCFNGKFLNKK